MTWLCEFPQPEQNLCKKNNKNMFWHKRWSKLDPEFDMPEFIQEEEMRI